VFHVKSGALAALAERYRLSERQAWQLAEILRQLQSDRHAPTTVREPRAAVDVHIADSLAALSLGMVHSAATIADLGAGVGFPGLALAVALPGVEVILVESNARKCAFIERVRLAAEIDNAQTACARAEEWREGSERADVVTARALAPQSVVLEYAAPLLRLGGTLIDWRGRRDAQGEAGSARAAVELGLQPQGILRAEPYEGAHDHHLHVFEKIAATPPRFPRRAGVARKRPLGA
jgi:16S rRNA (guanine527-N7)-methyltransferase